MSVESFKVLAEIDEDTMVVNQVYKRVQPAATRDCTFVSHKRNMPGLSTIHNKYC